MLVYKQIAMNKILIVLSVVTATAPVYGQQGAPKQPAAAFQDMFEKFANQAGPGVPIFGKLTPEQQEQLDRIKISVAEEKQFGQVTSAYDLGTLANGTRRVPTTLGRIASHYEKSAPNVGRKIFS